ncbi:hypothetical protein AC579_5867 [Pseudocercospora musae]|uniref:Uncharacterized protein n=1 Tax=Pseudocercospora musae TaxID=113226 RepID=A0A139HX92_9PEZI|nr:hypothetical protein AC579_5867 [Pseudocercospora musae]
MRLQRCYTTGGLCHRIIVIFNTCSEVVSSIIIGSIFQQQERATDAERLEPKAPRKHNMRLCIRVRCQFQHPVSWSRPPTWEWSKMPGCASARGSMLAGLVDSCPEDQGVHPYCCRAARGYVPFVTLHSSMIWLLGEQSGFVFVTVSRERGLEGVDVTITPSLQPQSRLASVLATSCGTVSRPPNYCKNYDGSKNRTAVIEAWTCD